MLPGAFQGVPESRKWTCRPAYRNLKGQCPLSFPEMTPKQAVTAGFIKVLDNSAAYTLPRWSL
jgi:hypothetical protein